MSDLAALPTPPIGRSLWQDARIRLLRNRAAVASLIVLALMTLACAFGPLLTGHPYDRVYQDYVRVPASLSSYPKAEALPAAVQRIASRIRATPSEVVAEATRVRLVLTAQRPIDQRLLVYFDRSDQFGTPAITANAQEGRRLSLEVPIKRQYFLFGTDSNGRDLLTRTLIAGRVSLAIGMLATGVALVIGVAYGATAGYLGGRIDMVMMRIVDVLYSLPFIFFVILLMVTFGSNIVLIFVAIGAVEWLTMSRIVRGQTLTLKNKEFVEAARAAGLGRAGVIARHIVPNLLGPVVVYVTLTIPAVILAESFLSFLGLGVQPPMASLGSLIASGASDMELAPWLLIFPSVVMVLTLMCFNFIGDGLRDAIDPRDR